MTLESKLQSVLDSLVEKTESESYTVRSMLTWYGAEKRSAYIVKNIRDMLKAKNLKTVPDFEDLQSLDDEIVFRRADAPDAVYSPKALKSAAAIVHRGEPSPNFTARELVSWFGAERRGQYIVQSIRAALDDLGVTTVPDFASAYIDAGLELVSTRPSTTPDADADATASAGDGTEQAEHGGDPSSDPPPEATEPHVGGAPDDAVLRIGTLPSANLRAVGRTLHRVAPTDSLSVVVTKMLQWDISQLPVMSDERQVLGVITWKSIAERLATRDGLHDRLAADFKVPHRVVDHDAPLLPAIPEIIEHEYVLVRGPHRTIDGIVTNADLSMQFREHTEPFLLMGEIENQIRRLIDGKFTATEIAEARNTADNASPVGSVHDLTFGEYVRLLQRPSNWNKLGLRIDRAIFCDLLDNLRLMRNDIMHFDPGAQKPDTLETLRRAARMMRDLHVVRSL